MSVQVEELARVFRYASMELADPGPHLSPEEVRDIYSASFPELATASIEGPEVTQGKLIYEFRRAAGSKG